MLGSSIQMVRSNVFDSPTIQGTVSAGTGLTMPAFTMSGVLKIADTAPGVVLIARDGNQLQVKNATNTENAHITALSANLGGIYYELSAAGTFDTQNTDAAYVAMRTRDTGVGLAEVLRLVGAADPYLQIGRDDTGVALNAVTDMLVLQAGGGTGNIAANFGLGISVVLASDLSVMAERASLDFVVTNPTLATYEAKWVFGAATAGAVASIVDIDGGGLNLASGKTLEVAGTKVIGAQGATVADAAGGATIDAEARTALNALLARVRTHGLIAT
ncbi:MAG: hypothetical protein Q8K68_13745 [Nitrospirota bacterium]|nr:hypothetical protein [Nitrospirota bacterium]